MTEVADRNKIFEKYDRDDVSGEMGERIANVFERSFNSLFKNNNSLDHLFFSLIKKLNKFFSISRAVLVVHSPRDEKLKAIALRGRKARQGLALTLPKRDSLLYTVFNKGDIYAENYSGIFKGNFIENKLLMIDKASSLVICPIRFKGRINALLCLTSQTLFAFNMFENGLLDSVLEQLGKFIDLELRRLHI